MGRVAGILADAIIVILLLLVVAFAGVRLVGLTPYAVLSGSMEPQFPVGSLIYVCDADPASIQPGDAVTFDNGHNQIVTHQAYEVDQDEQLIRTQGIANQSSDGTILHDAEPVPFSRVLGIPALCIPLLGYVNAWCTSSPGIFIVIALAIIAIALSWLGSSLRGKASGTAKQEPYTGKHARR